MKNKQNNILIVIIIVLVAIICFLLGSNMNSNNRDESVPVEVESSNVSTGGMGLTIDKNAGEYVAPVVEESEVPSKGVAIPGWGSLTIPVNTNDVIVDFMNPEANADLYYLTFELRLVDDSEQGYEVLYKSGLVEPGLHIQNITLSRGLEAGEYEAIIHVQPYRMNEEKTPTNNADMKTKLIVK